MKIGIDARMIDWGGVGRYTANLLRAIGKLGCDHDIVLFCLGETADQVPEAPCFTKQVVNQPVFSMPGQLSWAREITSQYLDLFHSPHFPVPLLFRGRMVVTLHDVIPLVFPESMPSKAAQIYFQQMARLAVRRAECIITVSEASKSSIAARLGVDPGKIRVIYEAADQHYKPIPKKQANKVVASAFGLTEPYLLHVGAQKPHKNVTGLIKAYAALPTALIEQYPLVLAGAEDKRFPQARQAVKQFKVRRNVHFLGFVSDEHLPALYASARALVYPSFYEGFGFPPLEAMACGTPVIASNSSAFPEILSDAGKLVDPHNIAQLTAAIKEILTDESQRKLLIQRGFAQVQKYSWERAARETIETYESVSGT